MARNAVRAPLLFARHQCRQDRQRRAERDAASRLVRKLGAVVNEFPHVEPAREVRQGGLQGRLLRLRPAAVRFVGHQHDRQLVRRRSDQAWAKAVHVDGRGETFGSAVSPGRVLRHARCDVRGEDEGGRVQRADLGGLGRRAGGERPDVHRVLHRQRVGFSVGQRLLRTLLQGVQGGTLRRRAGQAVSRLPVQEPAQL